jgi:hypothetical protein
MTIVARAPSPPGRRSHHGVVVLGAIALVVLTLAGIRALASPVRQQAVRPSRAPSPKPTRENAIRVATTALYELTLPAILDRPRFDAAVVRLAEPGAAPQVTAAFGDAAAALSSKFASAPRVLRSAALGYRISPSAASVSIWTVTIAASRSFPATAQWRTVTIDLTWAPTGWQVSGGSGAPGPDATTPLSQLAREATGFRSYTDVP